MGSDKTGEGGKEQREGLSLRRGMRHDALGRCGGRIDASVVPHDSQKSAPSTHLTA